MAAKPATPNQSRGQSRGTVRRDTLHPASETRLLTAPNRSTCPPACLPGRGGRGGGEGGDKSHQLSLTSIRPARARIAVHTPSNVRYKKRAVLHRRWGAWTSGGMGCAHVLRSVQCCRRWRLASTANLHPSRSGADTNQLPYAVAFCGQSKAPNHPSLLILLASSQAMRQHTRSL
ncbi:hypothetical protein LX36DRAFT_659345 [Colletotrichum falcatum]|nr:hypothetical protein LX36DRAFT_659345 [Colletotrichum falcatum]